MAASVYCLLFIKFYIFILGAPANFTLTQGSVTPNTGDTLSFTCFPDSDAPYKWFKNGQEIQQDQDSPITISTLTKSDSGNYTCKTNTTEVSKHIEITVQCMSFVTSH